jgi:hypothetical protein
VVQVAGPKALAWIDEAAAEAEARARAAEATAVEADEDLLAHGLAGEALRRRLRRAALTEVVLPCARGARDLRVAA